jgi:AcrR family transcriptional regulator
MPKVSDEYRATKRDEIAAAAMRAFHRGGFQGTSMADIIAESGLSAGAIYGHFTSKNEIVLEVVARVVGARMDEIEEFISRTPMPPPAMLVRVLMGGMLHDLGGRPTLIVQVWGESMTDPLVHRLANTVMGRLRGLYVEYISLWHQRQNGLSQTEGDALAEEQSSLFLASAQGFILQSALFDDFDGDAYLASIEKHLPR